MKIRITPDQIISHADLFDTLNIVRHNVMKYEGRHLPVIKSKFLPNEKEIYDVDGHLTFSNEFPHSAPKYKNYYDYLLEYVWEVTDIDIFTVGDTVYEVCQINTLFIDATCLSDDDEGVFAYNFGAESGSSERVIVEYAPGDPKYEEALRDARISGRI